MSLNRLKLGIGIILTLSTVQAWAPVWAVDKVYFRTYDGEAFACDRNDLEYHLDPDGKLSAICNFGSEMEPEMKVDETQTAGTAGNPFELNVNGKLFKKYVLDLFRYGKVAFKNAADAENTLTICEDLGLPLAEEHICKALKRKPRREMQKSGLELHRLENDQNLSLNLDCPEGYVLVPGNESYNTPGRGEDFCVMKYASSQGENGKAVSQQGRLPWVNINRANAEAACRSNGEGYHLITNSEWMTIARDIESNPLNWNHGNGPVGEGTLSRGNSNSNAALSSGPDENPYLGLSTTDWLHNRTHKLSNGNVIWDMSGNVWQWVADNLISARDGWKEYSDMGRFPLQSELRLQFGANGSYDSNQGMGKIYMSDAGAVLRGGAWSNATSAGVFAAVLDNSATLTYVSVGFRCAFSASGAR